MKLEKTIGIKINRKDTEKIRKTLIQKNLIRSDLKIKKNDNYNIIPIKKLVDDIKHFNIVELNFKKQNNFLML